MTLYISFDMGISFYSFSVLILIFSDATYFTMLFAAGIGIGLFYFGVAETIFHYQPGEFGNRYWDR